MAIDIYTNAPESYDWGTDWSQGVVGYLMDAGLSTNPRGVRKVSVPNSEGDVLAGEQLVRYRSGLYYACLQESFDRDVAIGLVIPVDTGEGVA